MKKYEHVNKILNDMIVTLTVPCQATPDHLAFIRWCAKEAGLSDNVSFIHEPTSALAQVFYYWLNNTGKSLGNGIYVIVDAGAGTTDVSIVELKTITRTVVNIKG
jgi:molecular chaperone DnaK (HSP70)